METVNPAQETNSSQSIQQPKAPSEPKQKKLIPIIAITLLVLIVGTAVYYLVNNKSSTPSSDNTNPPIESTNNKIADWKTYVHQDPNIPFSINYPSDPLVKVEIKNNEPHIKFCKLSPSLVSIYMDYRDKGINEDDYQYNGILGVHIVMQPRQDDFNVDQFVNNICTTDSWVLNSKTTKTSEVINGIPTTRYLGEIAPRWGMGNLVIVPKDKMVFMIYGWSVDGAFRTELFNTMLSTFTTP